ncbi:hypothetical protein [Photobacterium ganghwense]|uniref:hypothetical protein n=1 Tax=Photobacterium ganghwense TaxID=320778 RepID=UPI00146FF884|nr:hypothetical protein [Photobacterium ganghwense]
MIVIQFIVSHSNYSLERYLIDELNASTAFDVERLRHAGGQMVISPHAFLLSTPHFYYQHHYFSQEKVLF